MASAGGGRRRGRGIVEKPLWSRCEREEDSLKEVKGIRKSEECPEEDKEKNGKKENGKRISGGRG